VTSLFSDPNAGAEDTLHQSKKFIRQGVGVGQQAQAAQGMDFNTLFGLLRGLAANPLSMNDQTTQGIIDRSNAGAQMGAQGATRKLGAAAGAKGDVRSGSTSMASRRIDTDLGAKMSDNIRQALVQQAVSRPQDLINASNAFMPALNQQNQIPLGLMQLLGGGGGSFAGTASNQFAHPDQSTNQFFSGLGTILSLLAL
jgi:hypothetical protein